VEIAATKPHYRLGPIERLSKAKVWYAVDVTFNAFLAGAGYLVTGWIKCSLGITGHSGTLDEEED